MHRISKLKKNNKTGNKSFNVGLARENMASFKYYILRIIDAIMKYLNGW